MLLQCRVQGVSVTAVGHSESGPLHAASLDSLWPLTWICAQELKEGAYRSVCSLLLPRVACCPLFSTGLLVCCRVQHLPDSGQNLARNIQLGVGLSATAYVPQIHCCYSMAAALTCFETSLRRKLVGFQFKMSFNEHAIPEHDISRERVVSALHAAPPAHLLRSAVRRYKA